MKKVRIYRIMLLVIIMVSLAVIGRYTSLGEFFSFESLQTKMRDAGITGILIFLGVFVVGTLMNIPGFLFIIVALLVYGYGMGIPIAYGGAFLSVLVHFLVIRSIGGKPLGEIKRPFIRKMMKKLEDQPVKTVTILRILLFVSPPANYALALSKVKLSDFIVGTLIGMILPMTLLILLLHFARDMVVAWVN